jgi:hypothetical protein
VIGPTPLLDFFKRGEVARDVRLEAAQGAIASRAYEQMAILIVLTEDADDEVRQAANETLSRIPAEALTSFLARSDTPTAMREFFASRGIVPNASATDTGGEADEEPPPIVSPPGGTPQEEHDEEEDRQTATQKLAKMGFSERLKAAVKGSREMRAMLIRDPNKMISAAVLSSPKLTEPEIESFSRMASISDEVLRIIGSNRQWTKNYNVVLGLTKNPKTPLAMSLNFLSRLNSRDLQQVSVDRNVPEPLRIAARKKVVANTSGRS